MQKKLQKADRKLTVYNKFIVCTIIFLFIITVYQSASVVALNILLELNVDKD